MKDIEPWDVLQSHVVLDRAWITVRSDRVRLPGGTELDEYYVVEYPDWAEVVCLDDDGRVVMIEQYRHGIGARSLELPAGVIDGGEAPLTGAQRELLEETGYEAEQWTSLGVLAPNPGRQTNRVHIFAAIGAQRVRDQSLDVSEQIHVRRMGVADVLDAATDGRIVHASHVAALLRAERAGLLTTSG